MSCILLKLIEANYTNIYIYIYNIQYMFQFSDIHFEHFDFLKHTTLYLTSHYLFLVLYDL